MGKHIHIPMENGYATFSRQPSPEMVEAVRQLAKAAYFVIFPTEEKAHFKPCYDTDQCFGLLCEDCERTIMEL